MSPAILTRSDRSPERYKPPLRAVGVDQIGKRLETLPLLAVRAGEPFRPGANTGGLELDMAHKKLSNGYAQIGPTVHVVGQHLGSIGNGVACVGRTDPLDQIPTQRLQLVLRLGVDVLAEVVLDGPGEVSYSLGKDVRQYS